MSELAERVISGDARALARAASIVENRRHEADSLLRELFPRTGRALVLGVTGAPGSGKSTLVDALASELRREGKTVGILAVDPTSPFSGGAILGDRIRMQAHYADPGVFIRSMATRGWLGGLARATTDMTLLLDAAGFDVILIETVGVGQDEVDIARLADVTMVVLVPGTGDDVQTIKAGIMEIADVFVINKADLPGAQKLEREVKANLKLSQGPQDWMPPVVMTVATERSGIAEALAAARSYQKTSVRRARSPDLWRLRLREMLRERVLERLPLDELDRAAADVAERRRDPYAVVQELLERVVPVDLRH
ncbi:MAG TPA: methylmalonyl Co-A mutase-associated GTPase MeaB [Bryobacteraceae bacterium]|jgi:LAO/AO transport system kinase|nr:methylmalonyl Co-A mutase-associated GTPase MeaB [Bryobacteraceae bacterium]